jgi:signal transduction histidine kinase
MDPQQRPSSQDMDERIRRAEQLAFAGTLAGGLIHEIKNPLNSFNLNLQLLAEDWAEANSPRERRALKRIQVLQSETRRLCDILDDFMNFVRGHKLVLVNCDLNRLIEELVLFVRPELESRKIDLRISSEEVPAVPVDANLLKQVFLNLILNASQAMQVEGTREIFLRTAREDEGVRVDVIDTGRGIPEKDLPRIFEAFFSTRKGGTGLGLPAARRIIEEHGGRIAVHSEQGKGSCFSVHLPARPPAGRTEADVAKEST